MNRKDKKQPLYLISVVCEMLHVHPQTLRMYEKEGLISPQRTKKQRLYSEHDVERLSLILQLTRELGVNKAGVDIILRMRQKLEILQYEVDAMMDYLEDDIRRDFREKLKKAFSESYERNP